MSPLVSNVLKAMLLMPLLVFPLLTQTTPAVSGHWEGAINLPDRELKVQFDLAQDEKGAWIGSISVPEQGSHDVPLANIAVKGAAASFVIANVGGDPTFNGTVDADGKTMKGEFTQGAATLSFSATRTGDAKIVPPEKSTPLAKEFLGTWEGTLKIEGMNTQLRLLLKLSNGADGIGSGALVSLDQGGGDIPLSSVVQKDAGLKFAVALVGGSYAGELKGAELVGQWTQGGRTLPLTLKRQAAKEK